MARPRKYNFDALLDEETEVMYIPYVLSARQSAYNFGKKHGFKVVVRKYEEPEDGRTGLPDGIYLKIQRGLQVPIEN